MGIELDLTALEGGRVLCAVSGGADSMCLLHLLLARGTDVVAAHFEHGIRGAESLADAAFVERWCRERGIECVVGHGDVPGCASENGLGIEEAARRLRYAFLERTAEEKGCGCIATAHNADDNAETMIFNLCRGTGLAGLRGIPERRGSIVRPLLGVTRAEIERYLEDNGIPHVEDSTNSSDDYSRNLIRHRVTPALREINPEMVRAAARTARLLRQDEDCLDSMAADFVRSRFDGESLPLRELNALHPAVASRVIRRLAGGGLAMEHVESVLRLCQSGELGFADIPGRRLRCESGRLWLTAAESVKLERRELRVGQSVVIPEAGLIVTAKNGFFCGEVNDLFKTYYFKCENINSAVTVGGRENGGSVRPQGRRCTKSLKSLFLEAGYTQKQRDATPVLRDGQGVLAVYGLAIDERMRPLPGDRVMIIQFRSTTEENSQDAQ